MISFLHGTIQSIGSKTVILNVHEVGYLVAIPKKEMEVMRPGEELSLYIHTHVREDDITLFGFRTLAQWEFFRMLLSVSGVGPKTALEILNVPLDQARSAILKRNLPFFVGIPGIGKKTAERICIDLEGKIPAAFISEAGDLRPSINEEIFQALITIGFSRNQVTEGLKKIPPEISAEKDIIEFFIKNQ